MESKSATTTWDDTMSQDDFMKKDRCILLDLNDNVVGAESKKISHVFGTKTPRGKLHRAFSVFLFDKDGKLLLQQRAKSKITFPNVWTNTCCSHPLVGCVPDEVDRPEDVASGKTPGVKRAALRKLKQELGIEPEDVPIRSFKFLTRLHYWAADVVTHGKNSPWGEHEIDYILFAQVDERPRSLKPNPEEVSDVKWVTLAELRDLMRPSTGLLWSPWFRIIVERFLVHWWKDLSRTLSTDDFVDLERIHRFDPTREHMGGAGSAGPWLDTSDSSSMDKGGAEEKKRADSA